MEVGYAWTEDNPEPGIDNMPIFFKDLGEVGRYFEGRHERDVRSGGKYLACTGGRIEIALLWEDDEADS